MFTWKLLQICGSVLDCVKNKVLAPHWEWGPTVYSKLRQQKVWMYHIVGYTVKLVCRKTSLQYSMWKCLFFFIRSLWTTCYSISVVNREYWQNMFLLGQNQESLRFSLVTNLMKLHCHCFISSIVISFPHFSHSFSTFKKVMIQLISLSL